MQKQSIQIWYTDTYIKKGDFFNPDKSLWYHTPEARYYFLHYHRHLELGICRAGSGFFYADGEKIFVKAPAISIVPPGINHCAESSKDDPSEWNFVYIDFKSLFEKTNGLIAANDIINRYSSFKSPVVITKKENKALYNLILLIFEEISLGEENYVNNVSNLLSTAMSLHERMGSKKEKDKNKKVFEKILPCINYINENLSKNISVKEIAKATYLSESTLNRCFKEYFNMSPYEYIEDIRIKNVKDLLTTDKSITTIAFDSGFKSISSFNRVFKSKYGISPREYRKTLAK